MNRLIRAYHDLLKLINLRNTRILREVNKSLDDALDDANEHAQRPMYDKDTRETKKGSGCCNDE